MLRHLITLGLVCAFGISCGRVETEKPNRILPPLTTLSPVAGVYFIADPSCQSGPSSSPLSIESGIIHQFGPTNSGGVGLTSLAETFSPLAFIATPTLASPHVAQTLMGGIFSRDCDNALTDQRSCLADGRSPGWREVGRRAPLKICRAKSEFARYSFEGVALTSLFYLESTLRDLEDAYTKALPRVTLEVLPNYESIYMNESTTNGQAVRVKTYFTHNLAYFPTDRKIVVFPESAQSQELYSSVGHLWESPFGIAHEASHHLEQMLAEASDVEWQTVWDPFEHHYLSARGNNRSLNPQTNARVKARSAISEGFADIMAFWTLKGGDQWIDSIYKLGGSRNPKVERFTVNDNREPKVLSDGAVRQLLGLACVGSCPFSFSFSAHDAGAIMAHAVYANLLLAREIAGLGDWTTTDGWRDMARLSIAWMEASLVEWNTRKLTDPDGLDVFDAAGRGIERALNLAIHTWQITPVQQEALRQRSCTLSKQLLPALRNPVFGQNGACPP